MQLQQCFLNVLLSGPLPTFINSVGPQKIFCLKELFLLILKIKIDTIAEHLLKHVRITVLNSLHINVKKFIKMPIFLTNKNNNEECQCFIFL